MAGQASTHFPQPVHFEDLLPHSRFFTATASNSHVLTHFRQPIQPMVQTFIVSLPLSQLEQRTTACFLRGTKLMRLLGQASTHLEQPLHFAGSIFATPLQTLTAPYSQALTQSPIPIQPYRQLEIPPARKVEAEQL